MAVYSRWTHLQHRQGPAPGPDPSTDNGQWLEAYGPGGAAILIDLDTRPPDLPARIRALLARSGASPGARGAVSYLFNRVGLLAFPAGTDREPLQSVALGAGAEDVVTAADGSAEVLTAPGDLDRVRSALEAAGLIPELAAVVRRAEAVVPVRGEEARQLLDLLEALAGEDGVRDVWCNARMADPEGPAP